jgi:hypothetical protein
VIIGTDLGISGNLNKTLILKSRIVVMATAKPRINISSKEAFLYFPKYNEKMELIIREIRIAKIPKTNTWNNIPVGNCPSNLNREESQAANSHEALSIIARAARLMLSICD